MTWIIICWLAAIALIVSSLWKKDFRPKVKSDAEIEIDLLRCARLAFPTAESDIAAVDNYYQLLYHFMLVRIKQSEDIADLKLKCVTLFNLKNKLISEAVRFDERYIVPLNRKQTITLSTSN